MKRLVLWLLAVTLVSLGGTSRPKEPARQVNAPSPVSWNSKDQTAPQHAVSSAAIFPRNSNGQTYGSALDGISLQTEPDLIEAYGAGGTFGYVRSLDLHGKMPRTPEEALAQERSGAGKVRKIPLYAVDGKTVIGVFNVGP